MFANKFNWIRAWVKFEADGDKMDEISAKFFIDIIMVDNWFTIPFKASLIKVNIFLNAYQKILSKISAWISGKISWTNWVYDRRLPSRVHIGC